jgi:hypothetical protein
VTRLIFDFVLLTRVIQRLDVNDFNGDTTALFAVMKRLPYLASVSLEGLAGTSKHRSNSHSLD